MKDNQTPAKGNRTIPEQTPEETAEMAAGLEAEHASLPPESGQRETEDGAEQASESAAEGKAGSESAAEDSTEDRAEDSTEDSAEDGAEIAARADNLHRLILSLQGALDEESEVVLKAPPASELQAVGVRKRQLLHEYETALSDWMHLSRDQVLPDDMRQRLQTSSTELLSSLRRNEQRLQAAMKAGAVLMNCISDAMTELRPHVPTYSALGQMNKTARKHPSVAFASEV